jgi:hypothetical protein
MLLVLHPKEKRIEIFNNVKEELYFTRDGFVHCYPQRIEILELTARLVPRHI